MTNINDVKKCREVLIDDLRHACYGEGDEYGILECCGNPDYLHHKEDCEKVKNYNLAISILDKLIAGELKEVGK